ncbi:PREDICTED: uncharacterized protein LOC109238095 [Nicotiana attenuata]|uniref:uncharacterized protein LOC109238095 n=1 Tax=Nicotiana attenuata TaxID=49451 RepID=UPI0009050585|nr:PREDICTED: uncharacterized protein LOC109238095 [Nicotiana attenuata]
MVCATTCLVFMAADWRSIFRKPRFLCLHGSRTSGQILKIQVFEKWPTQVVEKLDLVFVDAPFPCQGKSEVEGIFDPPYYEWFQFNKEFTEYQNFDKCLAYISIRLNFSLHYRS